MSGCRDRDRAWGRLDSTNAIGVPEVTVVTKIGYDHMAVLGDTLDKIAAEKAGIIKNGTKLVLESQEKMQWMFCWKQRKRSSY